MSCFGLGAAADVGVGLLFLVDVLFYANDCTRRAIARSSFVNRILILGPSGDAAPLRGTAIGVGAGTGTSMCLMNVNGIGAGVGMSNPDTRMQLRRKSSFGLVIETISGGASPVSVVGVFRFRANGGMHGTRLSSLDAFKKTSDGGLRLLPCATGGCKRDSCLVALGRGPINRCKVAIHGPGSLSRGGVVITSFKVSRWWALVTKLLLLRVWVYRGSCSP